MAVVPVIGLQPVDPSLAPILSWGNMPIQGEFGRLEGTAAVEEDWFLNSVSPGFFA